EDVFASRPHGERAVPVGSPAVHVRLGVEGTGHVVAGVHVEDSPHPGYRPRPVAYCPVAQPELPGFVVAPAAQAAFQDQCTGVPGAGFSLEDGSQVDLHRSRGDSRAGGPVAETARVAPTPCLLEFVSDTRVAVADAQGDRICDTGHLNGCVARGIAPVAEASVLSESPAIHPAVVPQGAGGVLTRLDGDDVVSPTTRFGVEVDSLLPVPRRPLAPWPQQ